MRIPRFVNYIQSSQSGGLKNLKQIENIFYYLLFTPQNINKIYEI